MAVADVEASAERLVARGAERLGPSVDPGPGVRYATLRDPFGAVVAVRQGSTLAAAPAAVAWHQLHTSDAQGSTALYTELFAWVHTQTLDVPDLEGGHRLFAFEVGGAPVGAIANTARWSGVHPHWQFFFPVSDVTAAVARVRELGGKAQAPVLVPSQGSLLAACDDPQGAAFGLVGRAG